MSEDAMLRSDSVPRSIESAFFAEIEDAHRSDGGTWISLAAPLAPPDSLVDRVEHDTAFFWSAPGDSPVAGLGVALRSDSLADAPRLSRSLRALDWRAVPFAGDLSEREELSGAGALRRAYGGHAFSTEANRRDDCWAALGRSFLFVPRWHYRNADGRGTLSYLVVPNSAPSKREGAADVVATLGALWQHLSQSAGTSSPAETFPLEWGEARDALPKEAWCRIVRDALQEIARGRYEKVVLGRRLDFPLDRPRLAGPPLARLRRDARSVFRFAIRRNSTTFLGASPERLLALREGRVTADALAGTAHGETMETLANEKERHEHALVARDIERTLSPLCRDVTIENGTEVHRVDRLAHLRTRFSGSLIDSRHVAEIVEGLHPTPAICGEPRDEAMKWIARVEPHDRGWFTGPIGWLDDGGEGEFAVAIRCALLTPNRLLLFAGAGIVAGSEPIAEFEETRLKMQTMARAFGIAR